MNNLLILKETWNLNTKEKTILKLLQGNFLNCWIIVKKNIKKENIKLIKMNFK